MNQVINKINHYLNSLSNVKFITIMLIFSYVLLLPVVPFRFLFSDMIPISDGAVHLKESGFIMKIFFGTFAIPFVETFVFQYGAITLLEQNKFLSKNKGIILLISAILFSINHTYDLFYMIDTFMIGILLAYSFMLYQISDKDLSPFGVTFLIHAIRNTITSILLLF